jgi:hypothetical protein
VRYPSLPRAFTGIRFLRHCVFLGLFAALAFRTVDLHAAEITFPPGAVINMREEGLRGDGSDQTDLFEKILTRYVGSYHHLYFPDGEYVISRTLQWRDAVGDPQSGLTLIGQSRDKTILRLADSAAGFRGPENKAMLLMFSQKVFSDDGNENSAFRNSLRNLTLDIGMGNPGAIAVDYLCSNIGGIQDVAIRSRDPAGGAIGLRIDRGYPGPALLRNVTIQGFRYGITTDCRIAGLVLEHVVLSGQRTAGIRNCYNSLSIRDLRSVNAVPAIQNLSCGEDPAKGPPAGMIVLIDAKLDGGAPGVSAIENTGSLLLRNVAAKGYANVLNNRGTAIPGRSIGEFTTSWGLARGRRSRFALFTGPTRTLSLPIREAPAYFDPDFRNWAIVTDSIYGAKPDDREDDCEGIRKALASGKSTIFFKRGSYLCGETLPIRGKVRHILGDNAWIRAREFKPEARKVLFLLDSGTSRDVRIENIDLRDNGEGNDTLTLIRHESKQVLTLAGVYMMCYSNSMRAYSAGPGAGNLHLEDVASTGASPWRFSPGQKIWARQFDPEGHGPKIINDGADLWVLGLKTENPGTVLQAFRNARTEILGGLMVPANAIDSATPAFDLEDSRASLSYGYINAKERAGEWYNVQVREKRGKRSRKLTWDSLSVAEGNKGRNLQVPLYCTPEEAAAAPAPAARPPR